MSRVSSLVSSWPTECLTNYWSEESQASLWTWWGGRCLLPSCFWTVIAQWGITPVQSTPAVHWVIHLRYRNTWQIRNDKTEQRVLSQSQSIWFGQFSYFVTRHPIELKGMLSNYFCSLMFSRNEMFYWCYNIPPAQLTVGNHCCAGWPTLANSYKMALIFVYLRQKQF